MYKRFKRLFEKAARGNGGAIKRNAVLAFMAPFYLLTRLVEAAYEYFAQDKTRKVIYMLEQSISQGISGGLIGRVIAGLAIVMLAQYVALPLTVLELAAGGYLASVFAAKGLVVGIDEARVQALIDGSKSSVARFDKLEQDFPAHSKPWNTLQMYKLTQQVKNTGAAQNDPVSENLARPTLA